MTGLKIEDIARGQRLVGVDPAGPVEVVAVAPGGQDAITLVFRSPAGVIGERMLFRDDETSLAEATATRPGRSPLTGRPSSWPPRRCASALPTCSTR